MINILEYGLSENRGGIETYLYKIVSHMDTEKFHFDFIDTNKNDPAMKKELSEYGCRFYKITHRRISAAKNRKELENLFSEHHFDILHFNVNTLSYDLPIRIALKHGCKVVVHSRNAGADYSIVTRTLHYIHYVMLPRRKIKMLAVSDKAGKWLFGKNAGFEVINNGVDVNKFRFSLETRNRIRNELELGDKLAIGVVGAFLPAKNHKFAIQIFQALHKKNPDSVLLLIGDGPLRGEIEQFAKNKDGIVFLGNRDDVDALYNALDIFLMPSLFEGFPNACLEAQTNGLTCIVSDVITREVDIGLCNYMSLEQTPEEWAKIMIKYESNTDKRLLAYKIVENQKKGIDTEINRLSSIFKTLVSK